MVRAKFKCISNEKNNLADTEDIRNIVLEAVVGDSDENKSFFRWTPSGNIRIGCVNENANKQFEVGKQYYVDFSEAT